MRYPLWAIRVQSTRRRSSCRLTTRTSSGSTAGPGGRRAWSLPFTRAGVSSTKAVTAFLAPSAALPGTRNLIVLEPRVLAPWDQVPLDAVDWPGKPHVTGRSLQLPEGLWELVHYRRAGSKHPGLEAWETARTSYSRNRRSRRRHSPPDRGAMPTAETAAPITPRAGRRARSDGGCSAGYRRDR